LGIAATEGDTEVDCVVAVNRHGNIVSPCGMCRELISDYSPEARVIIPGQNGPTTVGIAQLLPNKYDKTGGPA
jgi:cytidine deaminase